MHKYLILLSLVTALGAFTGFGGDRSNSSGAGSSSPDIFRTITKAEFRADLQNANGAEQQLDEAGFSFTIVSDSDRVIYGWDQETLHAGRQTSNSQRIVALQNYILVSNDFLSKYAGQFNIDGEDPAKVYEATNTDAISAKRGLAQKTLDKLNAGPSD